MLLLVVAALAQDPLPTALFFGGGVGAGIYAFDNIAPNVFAFCEGGTAFLRNSNSRVYVTGRVAGTFDTVDEQFRLIAGVHAVAGF